MLPAAFLERMKGLLCDDYESFVSSLDLPAVRAIRYNPVKCGELSEEFNPLGAKEPIPYTPFAYYAPSAEGLGNTPWHHAGAFYMQDPGAMISLEAVDVTPDMRIIDLCAAPGGKTTQVAARLSGDGFILANEIVPKRAKILVSNIERLGIKNATVTSLDTSDIAKLFSNYFDLVILDAPCSGEGMFRKGEVAREQWSEAAVSLCQRRQEEILKNARGLVKPSGYIVYSTCTYSLEENEMVIDRFLRENPDFELCEASERVRLATADGIQFPGAYSSCLCRCRRFYPHLALGEGQFVAVLRRLAGSLQEKILYKTQETALTKDEGRIVSAFFDECLQSAPSGRVCRVGDNIVLLPHSLPTPPRSVFMSGVLIGEIRGRVLVPSHQFFSVFGKLFKRKENITDEGTAIKYLSGEEIDTDIKENGFVAVLYCGIPLGGGKAVLGKIKNHYPKGLRL